MTEEYLLAWNDHHSTFFTAMSELVSGDVLTDVSIWAGQTLYTAHKLVLALSSSYFKLVLTGVSREGRLPVIFLKDVSSKDFERLLSYMYHGEVSVPQSDLLSLIGAARSLGIRGLAEELQETEHRQSDKEIKIKETRDRDRDKDRDRDRERDRDRGLKREGEDTIVSSASTVGTKKMRQQGFPKLQHKLAGQKIWLRQEETKADREEAGKTEPSREAGEKPSSEKVGKENGRKGEEKESGRGERTRSLETESSEKEPSPGKNFSPFLEVNVKQEEEEVGGEESHAISQSPEEFFSGPALSLVRRTLLPPLIPNTRTASASLINHSSSNSAAVTRSTGTCHFCGRSFMKNKQLMNHVCPMRPTGK